MDRKEKGRLWNEKQSECEIFPVGAGGMREFYFLGVDDVRR